MMAISAPAVPGAAEAVRQAGRKDVNVIGLSLPNINKPYVHDGVRADGRPLEHARSGIPRRLRERARRRRTSSRPARDALTAGRLGQIEVRDSQIILGAPMLFNKSNIDRFDF